MAAPGRTLAAELAAIVGAEAVLDGSDPVYSRDATETRGIEGHADAVAFPRTTEEVARVLAWCYEHDVPLDAARRRYRLRGRRSARRGRTRARARPARPRARVRAAALARTRRGRRPHGPRPPARARERAPLPARSGRVRAVADRRQHRDERRRPARVQVRRHRPLGDRARGGRPARRARSRSAGRSARTSPATTSRAC